MEFIYGLFLGGFGGILLMALLAMAKDEAREDDNDG
jgi:hypothetical protein